ncbi:T9SS type A sorting domain-containing protein [Spirosoma validum]|uniref:T9SS type A sorting domain-containing protein n=1 Tax=Spirosoma validum TaxID=2771355 RepID=A0A927GG76_9BACT|nr:T9SS type A sorting domain-containing protein [Spirosoma validum]MBD2756581.1 T9SS type A sorting domain-containing protein [Spirosoma validum]
MGTYKLTGYLTAILLTVFSLVNSFGQQLQEDDPSVFDFGSSQQMLHGNFRGYDYVESCNQSSKIVSIKYKDYIYVAWIGSIGSVNVACLGSTHQKELLQPGNANPNVYHGYQDTLGGFAYANYVPTMAVYEDKLYIFYNRQKDNQVKYLAITQEGTVTIAERGDLPGSPTDLVNIVAYPLPEVDGLIFFGKGANDNHIRTYVVGKKLNYLPYTKYSTWRQIYDQTLSDQCVGNVSLCEVSGGRRLVAWTGTDSHLNTAFLDYANNYDFVLLDKHTHTDHSSHIDGPLLFRKENADDTDVHILWRGVNDDTKIYQGVINPDNKNTFGQFAMESKIVTTNFTPTLISLNEMTTYMFWPAATASDPPYNTRYTIMMAKGFDYKRQDWMGTLTKDEHTLKNLVLPGSHNAGMNDATQISAFPTFYKALNIPDFGACNECGFVTQTLDIKEQMEMGFRYFGINLTNAHYTPNDIRNNPYYDDENLLHTSVQPVDHGMSTSTCLGEGFENILKNARAFLHDHPKEFIIINIKDTNFTETSTTSIVDDMNAILPKFKDVIYQKTYEKTFADLINQPIGNFRGKIILTVAGSSFADVVHLIQDVFETSHDNQYRYVNTTNASTDKLIQNQTNFFNNASYTGSYKRMDWQISLTLEKVLCDLRPYNACKESPKPGFWHHVMHIAECAGELYEMGETIVEAIAEPEDPRNAIKIVGWIASTFGNTSLTTVQNNNKHLYPTVYDMVRNKIIRQNNMVNIVYAEGVDYLYTDLCMQLLTDFNEYDDVNPHNNYIQVASSHVGVTCANPKSGIASIRVKGGVAPYTYHWLSTGDTTATVTGLPEGYHKVRITDAMGHKVTRKVYVSMQPHAHSSLAYSNVSKTEVQPYGLPNHYEADCDQLIAKIESDYMTTGVGDSVTASVWIDKKPNGEYVRRHYQLMPAKNAAVATASVTLYFTQQDFDEYNRQGTLYKLPANSQDSARMRNLIIWQKPGKTSDGSGLLLTYTAKKKEIFLKTSDVVWNEEARRWEVSFHTEGFGGYFLATYDVQQKNEWLRADAYVTSGKPLIQWQVAEKNIRQYYVEYSFDGRNFAQAGSLASSGMGQHTYQFSHLAFQKPTTSFSQEIVYYRVRQLANDGQFSLSEIMPVSLADSERLLVYPNPFSTELSILSSIETTAAICDITGRVIYNATLQKGKNQISVALLPPGFYIIKTASGESHRLVKAP